MDKRVAAKVAVHYVSSTYANGLLMSIKKTVAMHCRSCHGYVDDRDCVTKFVRL